jgi:serine/threonine protein kinase
MIGRTISHYKVLQEISRGGMGIVYRALDVKLNREVALKVLPPGLLSDVERKRRFVQEAQAAAALKHPNVAVVHEIDEVDGETFIAMELIEGKILSETLERGPLPLGNALRIGREIAEGLAKAHEKGIVHRDLKPSNVMLTEDGHGKIIDFGLAKLVEPLSGGGSIAETAVRQETAAGTLLGTIGYMSPEQVRGREIDHRSDIFSFGTVLYEMISGRRPFEGDTPADTLSDILNQAPPRLPRQIPAGVQALLQRCLQKDPGQRFQNTLDLVRALQDAEAQLDRKPRRGRLVLAFVLVLSIAAGTWWVTKKETHNRWQRGQNRFGARRRFRQPNR